jgi:hypothetical protein
MVKPKASDRVGELEDELKRRDERIAELRDEVDELRDLMRRLEEAEQDYINCLEAWKDAFGLIQTESGGWTWEPFWSEYKQLMDDYNNLVRRWNKYLPLINGRTQPVGRPLAADEDEQSLVLAHRKAGMSLREIAEETELGLNTVRTIIGKANGSDRATRRRWQKAHPGEVWSERTYKPLGRIELDRQQALSWKRRKRTGDALPKRAQAVVEAGRELLKEAKGRK